jgi:predicted DNA-binding WGR domain protein
VRRFEFVEGKSAKFWQAEAVGATFIVEFGRLGTKGVLPLKANSKTVLKSSKGSTMLPQHYVDYSMDPTRASSS